MPTVELRSGLLVGNTRIHTYIYITHDDGSPPEAYGFYPADSGLSGLNGNGEVRSDLNTDYNSSSGEIPISDTQLEALKEYINQSIENPSPYSLPFGSHCTTWALEGLVISEILPEDFSPSFFPDGFWEDLKQSFLWNPAWFVLGDKINDFFRDAMNWFPRLDPLTLDLNGDGIKTLPADGQVLFDHNGDGIKEGTGWIAPTDGILVLDRNGNGTIDSGRELFGDNTIKNNGQRAAHGFDALSDLDSNADGKIDNTDAQWSQLKIWKDANSDGISQAGELFALGAVNGTSIKQINLANTAGNINVGNGNVATANGTFVWNDGHTGAAESTASNLDLAANPFYREFTDSIPIPENKLDLVDMQGSGAVRDLREAA